MQNHYTLAETMKTGAACACALIFLGWAQRAVAEQLPLAYGALAGDVSTPPNDDLYSFPLALAEPMRFFGDVVYQAVQNTNGDVTFDDGYSEGIPALIPSTQIPPMMAIYWTDIDTRNGGLDQNELWARASSNPKDLLNATKIVKVIGGDALNFEATAAFVATWNRVEAFSHRSGAQNTMQLIAVYNEAQTWVIFAYRQLEFYLTDSAAEAVVGFNDPQGIEGSMVKIVTSNEDMKALLTDSNCGIPGTFVYRVDDEMMFNGCGNLRFGPDLRPAYGEQSGGTVIQIQNLPSCLDDSGLEVYCRFAGSGINQVEQGFRVNRAAIECLTPYAGFQTSVEVSYAAHDPTVGPFDEATAEWILLERPFQYNQDQPAVVLTDEDYLESIKAGIPTTIAWSAAALMESALSSLQLGTNGTSSTQVQVEVEVLAYNFATSLFTAVQSTPLPANNLNETQIIVPEAAIQNVLVASTTGNVNVAVILIRLVAFMMVGESPRIGSTRTSQLLSVFPANLPSRKLGGFGNDGDSPRRLHMTTCPTFLVPDTMCPDLADTPPCPPSYALADADPTFADDTSCTFPDGAGACNSGLYIQADAVSTCILGGQDPLECSQKYSTDPLSDLTACACHYFHNFSAGCVLNSGSQCCYSASGALLTVPGQGAGTANCYAEGGILKAPMHFLTDIVPYILCCKTLGSEACADFYRRRPPVSSEGYQPPQPPARATGDPHLRTLDGIQYDFNGYGEYVAFCGIPEGGGSYGLLAVSDLVAKCSPFATRLIPAGDGINPVLIHFRFGTHQATDAGTVTTGVSMADPLHNNGLDAIMVLPHPTRRVDVYSGWTRLIFPSVSAAQNMTSFSFESGLTIQRTANIQPDGELRIIISSPSGLRLEITDIDGVMLPSVSVPASLRNARAIGLLGRADGDPSNDLVDSGGAQYASDATAQALFSFGQSWMVQSASSSLFQKFEDSTEPFTTFYNPAYVPSFVTPGMSADLKRQADAACAAIASANLRDNCYFDIAATGDAHTFAAVSNATVAEDKSRVRVVTNQAPIIMGNDTMQARVLPGRAAAYTIVATDPDGDALTIGFDRNDGGLFQLTIVGNGNANLTFAGTMVLGNYTAWVSVSDGLAPAMYTATASVQQATTLRECRLLIRQTCRCNTRDKGLTCATAVVQTSCDVHSSQSGGASLVNSDITNQERNLVNEFVRSCGGGHLRG